MSEDAISDHELSEAMAHITQILARFVDGFQEQMTTILDHCYPILEEIAEKADALVQQWRSMYDAVYDSYQKQGAIYGDTHNGMMRWLRELSQVESLRAEADLIVERQQMLRDLAIKLRPSLRCD